MGCYFKRERGNREATSISSVMNHASTTQRGDSAVARATSQPTRLTNKQCYLFGTTYSISGTSRRKLAWWDIPGVGTREQTAFLVQSKDSPPCFSTASRPCQHQSPLWRSDEGWTFIYRTLRTEQIAFYYTSILQNTPDIRNPADCTSCFPLSFHYWKHFRLIENLSKSDVRNCSNKRNILRIWSEFLIFDSTQVNPFCHRMYFST